jgi:hypothetical protein
MDAFKDVVCGFVSALTIPPAFDNSFVVSIDFDVAVMHFAYNLAKGLDDELESKCFHPADVPPVCFPAGDEVPCPPFVGDGDSDANT